MAFDAAWVIDFEWPAERAQDARSADIIATCVACGGRAMRAVEGTAARIYFAADAPAGAGNVHVREALERSSLLPAARSCALRTLVALHGASLGAAPVFHYVVETDVAAAHEDDFNAWYDQEHLAGLAGVPGTIFAARYERADRRPLYGACYDLGSLHTFGSARWMVVRTTAWSSRVRPSFRNTTRTMYRLLPTA
ncbi:MAG TPA: hypothetical protein VGH59_09105 [Casimicrobiaceae bacterium]|jgi:hypothetical protein